MRTITALALDFPCVVAVVGCGGKTSLIDRIADSYPEKRVLISPTTKMFPMQAGKADCRGILNPSTGKFEAFTPCELADLVKHYDLSLLEADGSRGKPCKGWRADEPVIPEYVDKTIGVVTLNALGRLAGDEWVHNLPQFLALTGIRAGERIEIRSLADMVVNPAGMFKNSVGGKILLVNQVEDGETAIRARLLLHAVQAARPGYFEKLLLGSVRRDHWEAL
ncbi:MAG: selenium cofactor biosynthesis protein YqeC [Oscillospiraceae bacterium]|nr:selenium cofactor biosynthesis protein YqeC [Oscillospiraceae bacterium]